MGQPSLGFAATEYRPRSPEQTVLYKTVANHIETHFAMLEGEGRHLPKFVRQENLFEAQRAWIRYRDVWIAFAKKHYPEVTEDSINAYLTKERTDMMREFNQGHAAP